MDLIINSSLMIPANEISWRFSRSSGSGGQNINKTDSRVEIIFDIDRSKKLNPYQKHNIHNQLKKKVVNGCICITVQEKRTQYQNRQIALTKLASVLLNALKAKPKARKITKPPRASKKRRLESKKKRGALKKSRLSKIDKDFE